MKEQSTSKGFAVLSAAGMLVKLLSFLYIPFLLRIIQGDKGYGIYSAAYQIYAFIYVITNSGIPVAISKMISEETAMHNYKDAVRSFKLARFILFLIGIVMTIFTVIFAWPLANLVGFSDSYYSVLALAPAVFFTSIASAYRGYFQGRGNMTPTAISQILEQVLNTIFTLVFAALLMKYGLAIGCAGGTIGTTIGAFFSAVYLIIFYERNKKFRAPKGYKSEKNIHLSNKQIIKKIFNYGIPITICVGMTWAGNLVDVTNTVSRLHAAGIIKTASALYGSLVKYQQLINVPIAIISALSAAILPAIASAAILKDKDEVKSKIDFAFRFCFMIAVPAAVGFAVLSKQIFLMIMGSKYLGGYKLMEMGSAFLILMSVVQIQITILQGMGKLYTATFYSVIGIAVKVAANYFLISIPSININGAVFGSMLGMLVPLILNHRMINKSLDLKVSLWEHFIKPLISSGTMGVIIFGAYFIFNKLVNVNYSYVKNAIATILVTVIGIYVYAFTMILIGGIKKKDIEVLPNVVKKFIPFRMAERAK